MSTELIGRTDERTHRALAELQGLIQAYYPAAVFTVAQGDDPPGLYLKAIVDVEETASVPEPTDFSGRESIVETPR